MRGPTKRTSGTGVVPGATIGDLSWRQGIANLVDTALVKHVSGGWSDVGFKAFEQGRGAFEGTAKYNPWTPAIENGQSVSLKKGARNVKVPAKVDAAAKRRGISRSAWIQFTVSRALDAGEG